MDYSKGWNEEMSLEDTKNLAYFERNMLALYLAKIMSLANQVQWGSPYGGWYYDTDNNWENWRRVISFDGGKATFHVPDDFDLGDLPQIKPNWNGSTTYEKWSYIKGHCGIE